MAQKNLSNLPDAIKKRDILFGVAKMTSESLKEMAQSFEQKGWLSDAMDFYNQNQDKESLKRIRKSTIAEGDTFLFLKACRLLDEVPESELLECAQRAESLGKLRYALKGFERLEHNPLAVEGATRIREKISQDADVVAEAASKVFIPASEDELIDEEIE